MSVTEVAGGAMGEWSLTLHENTPQDVLDQIDYYGHVAILSGQLDPTRYGDSLLNDARYVGVLRTRKFAVGPKEIAGAGMSFWIGDEDGKGHAIEEEISFVNAPFNTAVTGLLPPTVTVGTIHGLTGLHTQKYKLMSRRDALDYLAELYNAEWRVNNNGSFDIGTPDLLYPTTPTCAIVRTLPEGGVDGDVRALPGVSGLAADVEDFSTRVVTVGEGNGLTVAVGTADIQVGLNPYKDLFGAALKMTRLVSEQNTSLVNADARAQLQLNRFTSPREAVSLSTQTHDIKGDLKVGSYVWVHDEEAKLIDNSNFIQFKGLRLYPVKLRVSELSWPVEAGMGVAYRHWNGTWIDLTPYMVWESGTTTVTVNGYNRSLTSGTTPNDPIAGQVTGANDSTVPDVPTWILPLKTATYNSPVDGYTRAEIRLKWTRPLNTDTSVIVDGGRYDIRFRKSSTSVWKKTNAEMALLTNDAINGTNENPDPLVVESWTQIVSPWAVEEMLMQDLTPGIPYEFQVRAVDNATPEHASAWSAVAEITTEPDRTAPDAPAAPEIAAGTLAIQLKHLLGAAGLTGSFNLSSDLHHLNLYSEYEPTFAVDPSTNLIGDVTANIGMLIAQTPVIKTFKIDDVEARWYRVTAVDNYGNESLPSEAVQQTATLLNSAYIDELTVSKVSGGTIMANWLQGAEIYTATSGSRVRIGYFGIELYNSQNLMTLDANTSDGSIYLIGTVATGRTGRRIVLDGVDNEILFFPQSSETRKARIFSYIPPIYPNDIALDIRAIDGDGATRVARHWLMPSAQSMQTAPLGAGGDLVNAASVYVGDTFVQMTAATISGAAPYTVASEHVQAKIFLTDAGRIYSEVSDPLGSIRGIVDITPTGIFIETQTSGDINGGYLRLDRGVGGTAYFGLKHTIVSVDKFLSFSQTETNWTNGGNTFIKLTGEFAFYRSGVQRMLTGPDGLLVSGSMLCSFYSGNGWAPFVGQVEGNGAQQGFKIRNDNVGLQAVLDVVGKASVYVKNFIIDHPEDKDRYLVHACTETPEAAVEYSGTTFSREWGELIEVELPGYFEAETHYENRQVWLQPMLNPEADLLPYMPRALPTYPKDGKFYITTDCAHAGVAISWKVKAVRKDVPKLNAEPLKSEITVKGTGPYTYFVEN